MCLSLKAVLQRLIPWWCHVDRKLKVKGRRNEERVRKRISNRAPSLQFKCRKDNDFEIFHLFVKMRNRFSFSFDQSDMTKLPSCLKDSKCILHIDLGMYSIRITAVED